MKHLTLTQKIVLIIGMACTFLPSVACSWTVEDTLGRMACQQTRGCK